MQLKNGCQNEKAIGKLTYCLLQLDEVWLVMALK
jgi:hypothetical protein